MKALWFLLCLFSVSTSAAPGDWTVWSPRAEATPRSQITETGGYDSKGALVLETGSGEHWIGCWTRTLAVEGGKHYRFHAMRRFENVSLPRRSVYARVIWQDENGKPVTWDESATQGYAAGTPPRADPRPHSCGGLAAAGGGP